MTRSTIERNIWSYEPKVPKRKLTKLLEGGPKEVDLSETPLGGCNRRRERSLLLETDNGLS